MIRSILRSALALVSGILIGGTINMVIVMIGPIVIPLPDGIDISDMDKFAENFNRFTPVNFVAPWLAHAMGTLVGSFIAAKIATTHKVKHALAIGVFFLLGGISMTALYGGPTWFAALDLIVAYLPMGYLGGILATKTFQRAEESEQAHLRVAANRVLVFPNFGLFQVERSA